MATAQQLQAQLAKAQETYNNFNSKGLTASAQNTANRIAQLQADINGQQTAATMGLTQQQPSYTPTQIQGVPTVEMGTGGGGGMGTPITTPIDGAVASAPTSQTSTAQYYAPVQPANVPPANNQPLNNQTLTGLTKDDVLAMINQNKTQAPDFSSFTKMITDAFANLGSTLKVPQVPKYDPKYESQMTGLANTLTDYYKTPFSYDPSKDAGLQTAQTQGMNRVKQDMVARGRLYSGYTDSAQQQAAQQLIPQFQQQSYQQYQDKGNNLANQLSMMQGLENTNYNRYRDTVGDTQDAFKTQFDINKGLIDMSNTLYEKGVTASNKQAESEDKAIKDYNTAMGLIDNPYTGKTEQTPESIRKDKELALKEQKQFEDSENSRFGFVLSETARKYDSTYQNLLANDPEFVKDIQKYQGNLAVLRDLYRKNGDEEGAIAVEGARLEKISKDPDLLERYGSEFGLGNVTKQVADMRKAQLETLKADLEVYLKQVQAKYEENNIELKLEKAKQDLRTGAYDEYVSSVKAANIDKATELDLISKAEQIRNVQDQISNRAERLNISKNAEARAEKNDTEKVSKTYEAIKDTLKTDIETIAVKSGDYWLNKGSAERKKAYDYAVQQLKESGLVGEEKVKMLRELGLTDFLK